RLAAVTFDAWGTLVRARKSVGYQYLKYAKSYGIDAVSQERLDAAVPSTLSAMLTERPNFDRASGAATAEAWWSEFIRRLFVAASDGALKPKDVPEIMCKNLRNFYKTPGAVELTEGCSETLEALAARSLKLGVLSNFDDRLPDILACLGVADRFAAVVSSFEADLVKPDPRIFALAAKRLGEEPGAILHVGDDRRNDFEAARACGFRALLLDPAGREAADVPQELRIERLDQLMQRLD
ncbi:hypothetical protein BOX15_Mlig023196g1, partial [Macrostomum lignano]